MELQYHILRGTDPNWSEMKLDNGPRPRWEMNTTGPDWEGVKFDGGPGWQLKEADPDWGMNLDGGPGWNPMTLLH